MENALKTFLLLLWLAIPATGIAQQKEDSPKPPKLFKSNDVLDVTMKGPWRRIMRNVSSQEKYAGSLEYTDVSGNRVTLSIGITTRGLTRRVEICDFAPLKLWFEKDEVKGTAFRGQNSLKMVTHCQRNTRYDQLYIKEYLAYRIYNLVTPYSFLVRPLKVRYLDTERDDDPLERFGFLIEDVDDMAGRNDAKELEIPEVAKDRLDPTVTSDYMVFQYLIANLDWSALTGPDPVECCHNSKLIGSGPDASPVYPVPYDLDFSGVVNAPYAAPPSGLRVKRITQRLYRGYCIHNAELPAALERFTARRGAILDLFRNEPLLTDRNRKVAINFLDQFYESLEKGDFIEKQMVGKCRP